MFTVIVFLTIGIAALVMSYATMYQISRQGNSFELWAILIICVSAFLLNISIAIGSVAYNRGAIDHAKGKIRVIEITPAIEKIYKVEF